jgi:hypothetical protein
MPQSMALQQEPVRNRAEVLYITSNGQVQPFEGGGRRQGQSTSSFLLYLIYSFF